MCSVLSVAGFGCTIDFFGVESPGGVDLDEEPIARATLSGLREATSCDDIRRGLARTYVMSTDLRFVDVVSRETSPETSVFSESVSAEAAKQLVNRSARELAKFKVAIQDQYYAAVSMPIARQKPVEVIATDDAVLFNSAYGVRAIVRNATGASYRWSDSRNLLLHRTGDRSVATIERVNEDNAEAQRTSGDPKLFDHQSDRPFLRVGTWSSIEPSEKTTQGDVSEYDFLLNGLLHSYGRYGERNHIASLDWISIVPSGVFLVYEEIEALYARKSEGRYMLGQSSVESLISAVYDEISEREVRRWLEVDCDGVLIPDSTEIGPEIMRIESWGNDPTVRERLTIVGAGQMHAHTAISDNNAPSDTRRYLLGWGRWHHDKPTGVIVRAESILDAVIPGLEDVGSLPVNVRSMAFVDSDGLRNLIQVTDSSVVMYRGELDGQNYEMAPVNVSASVDFNGTSNLYDFGDVWVLQYDSNWPSAVGMHWSQPSDKMASFDLQYDASSQWQFDAANRQWFGLQYGPPSTEHARPVVLERFIVNDSGSREILQEIELASATGSVYLDGSDASLLWDAESENLWVRAIRVDATAVEYVLLHWSITATGALGAEDILVYGTRACNTSSTELSCSQFSEDYQFTRYWIDPKSDDLYLLGDIVSRIPIP